jgi:hypothetical protein
LSATQVGRVVLKALPLRRIRGRFRYHLDVTAGMATSRGVGCAAECCCVVAYRAVGLPDPAVTSPFPARLAVFRSHRPPITCVSGFILSCASLPSRVSRFRTRRSPFGPRRLPWGPLPLRDVSRWSPLPARRPRPRYVPSTTFLTSSTACSSTDLCGFVSPRCHVQGSLSEGFPCHTAGRAHRSPVPSCRSRLPPTAGCPTAPETRARLQGLAPCASPLPVMGV